ncbi:chemotaxis protein [Desulfovibrio aminophilus]|nr:chemotaxis protein [Desulfovibrio aminophilus]MCM0755954.1 chemotaxis protein [Desulfovibrio aminophilus]
MAATDTGILLETGTNELEIIEFFVDESTPDGPSRHHFGVNVAKVLEVVEAPEGLAPSPAASHPSFLGAVPLRDLILPVVDLAVWLGMERQPTRNEPIIVTEFNNTITGFLVSGVTMIHRVNWTDVEPPSHFVANMHGNCITGTLDMDGHFALLLDLELALAELDKTYAAQDQADIPRAEERFRALVADDSTSVRQLLRQNFETANFEVRVVNDGQEAWEALAAIRDQARSEGRPVSDFLDVLVSDVEMPRLDGYTLTRRVKEDKDLSGLPVVLFSSLISKGLRHKGEAVKADDQVTKPEFAMLTERVLAVIRARR